MFKLARIKLTLWYLLIIMTVSLAFSAIIYRASVFELRRFALAQQNRFEHRITPFTNVTIDDELILEAQGRMRYSLLLINLGILVASGGLGYYLSGKTLSPIQAMVEDQYRFISDASHELKTPITAIKTTLEVALRDPKLTSREAKEILQTNLEEANRLQRLAEGLLELTHQNVLPTLVPTRLDTILTEAIQLISPIAERKHVQITFKSNNVVVRADSLSLRRAIVAILDNAVKYSPAKSKIEITTKVTARTVMLKISDKGDGIPTTDLPHVFDRFYRGDPARSSKGYGLGLPITKQIIENHRGTIVIESKAGKGTTVTIALPYSAPLQKSTS